MSVARCVVRSGGVVHCGRGAGSAKCLVGAVLIFASNRGIRRRPSPRRKRGITGPPRTTCRAGTGRSFGSAGEPATRHPRPGDSVNRRPATGLWQRRSGLGTVRPLILEALGDLPDVEVILYPPHGAPSAQTMTVRTERPRMGRAGGAVDHGQPLHPPSPDGGRGGYGWRFTSCSPPPAAWRRICARPCRVHTGRVCGA